MRIDAHPTVEDLKVTLLESVKACGRHGLTLLRVEFVPMWRALQGVPDRETTSYDTRWACPACVDERHDISSHFGSQRRADNLVDLESGLSDDRCGEIILEWTPLVLGTLQGHIGDFRVIDNGGQIISADTGKTLGVLDCARGRLTPLVSGGWPKRSYYVLTYEYNRARITVDLSTVELKLVTTMLTAIRDEEVCAQHPHGL
jgi:hypothetical protein